jgi:hypothetical protein
MIRGVRALTTRRFGSSLIQALMAKDMDAASRKGSERFASLGSR